MPGYGVSCGRCTEPADGVGPFAPPAAFGGAVSVPSGGGAACFVRDTALDAGRTDELWCGALGPGGIVAPALAIVEPRGVLSLQLAADLQKLGLAWQAQEEDDTRVGFAVATCRATASASVAAAPARR